MPDENTNQLKVPAEFPEILKSLSREILRSQPTDIYQFCYTYFATKIGERQKRTPTDKKEDVKKEEVAAEHEAASDDEDDEPYVEPVAKPSIDPSRNRRTSVSAESMDPTAADTEFVKIVIPKTEEQKSRIEKSIRGNFLFKNLDEEQYLDVVNAMAEKQVSPGEEVIKQGGIGDYFYVVETGNLDIFVAKNGNPPVKVTTTTSGGSFGELALMYNAPRAATVVSTSDCVLWALDRVTFRRILMENASKKRRMYESFLEEVPILISLEPYERHKIADALESASYNEGDVIIKQGDVGDDFYIIESGEAECTQLDEAGVSHSVLLLKKGDYFGELALLNNEPRKATVTAKGGKLKVAYLNKKGFVRLLGPVVDIIKRNANTYETHLGKLNA